MSVRRAGEALRGKFGDIALQAGDEVLFDAAADFDGEAAVVHRNLQDLQESGGQHEREFMFAFCVEGALRWLLLDR